MESPPSEAFDRVQSQAPQALRRSREREEPLIRRLLFVYGYAPSGHASASWALEAGARGRGLEPLEINVSRDHHEFWGPTVARAYLELIHFCPGVWQAVYDNPAVALLARPWRWIYLAAAGGALSRRLGALSPEIVVCTHAPPMSVLAAYKSRFGAAWPLVAVLTDYRVHSYWVDPRADLYLVPTEHTAKDLVTKGIPRSQIAATGIPIHPDFEHPIAREEARRRLGIPDETPVFLVSGGSRGLGRLKGIVDSLLASAPDARVLLLCGHDQALFEGFKARFKGEARLWPYPELGSERLKELMSAADLLVGKAGGLTTAEAMAVGLPMLIFEPVPGQEERNCEYLVGAGAAARAVKLEHLGALAAEIVRGGVLDAMRLKAKSLGRPDSTRRGLEAILSLAGAVRRNF